MSTISLSFVLGLTILLLAAEIGKGKSIKDRNGKGTAISKFFSCDDSLANIVIGVSVIFLVTRYITGHCTR